MAPGFYEGCIPEAIATAQKTSKLLVVYVSDSGEESSRLEESWSSSKVLSIISEKVVALHLIHGGVDALNFSALYPYSKAPSITVIGHGCKIWQHEGYISADELAGNLEQVVDVYRMQMQQATASLLASLFSTTPSQASSSRGRNIPSSSNAVSPQANIPSEDTTRHDIPSLELNTTMEKMETEQDDTTGMEQEDCREDTPTEVTGIDTTEEAIVSLDLTASIEPTGTEEDAHVEEFPEVSMPTVEVFVQDAGNMAEEENQIVSEAGNNTNNTETDIPSQEMKTEEVKECVSEVSALKGPETKPPLRIFLHIRMMDSGLIKGEFEPSDNLWAVKEFVDTNNPALAKTNYRFATPFPRKVFSSEDHDTPLGELSIGSRAVLMVVPTNDPKPLVKKVKLAAPSAGTGRWLSYLNPLSYLRAGNAATNVAGPSSPPGKSSGNVSPTKKNSIPRWGSNIHSLKHDDDDEEIRRRGNTYWNGNSTQFGGEDNDKHE